MPKAKEGNIYDLVEEAAARRGIPRLKLWQDAARALTEKQLQALNLSDRMDPAMTFGEWLWGLRAAVDRENDPASCARILRHIIVRVSVFNKWLSKASKTPRGPRHGTTGLAALDRKLFPQVTAMIKKGDARSAYGAAKILADDKKIAGGGTAESRAKRLETRYLRAKDNH